MPALSHSLQTLLEAPLEEELFRDWAQLLELYIAKYTPPTNHLALCFTLLVHTDAEKDDNLRATCQRIIGRSLQVHGTSIFRQVLDFQPTSVARYQRKKLA